jgi:hypothetical protein
MSFVNDWYTLDHGGAYGTSGTDDVNRDFRLGLFGTT